MAYYMTFGPSLLVALFAGEKMYDEYLLRLHHITSS